MMETPAWEVPLNYFRMFNETNAWIGFKSGVLRRTPKAYAIPPSSVPPVRLLCLGLMARR